MWLVIGILACSGPKPAFQIEQEEYSVPAVVRFINLSKDAEQFVWEFGDGSSSEEISPEHRYLLSGRYMVKLIARQGEKQKVMEKEVILKAPEKCLLVMQTTAGSMLIQLYDATPAHRDNFIKLAEEGFYDGMLFHRVINGFMIQTGDPDSKNATSGQPLGGGGPGYQIDAEFVDSLLHFKGALAAARQSDQVNPKRKSSGSQFYIVQGRKLNEDQWQQIENRVGRRYTEQQKQKYQEIGGTPFLDGQYTVFGKVVEGMEVIDSIASVPTNQRDRPLNDIKIIDITVIK